MAGQLAFEVLAVGRIRVFLHDHFVGFDRLVIGAHLVFVEPALAVLRLDGVGRGGIVGGDRIIEPDRPGEILFIPEGLFGLAVDDAGGVDLFAEQGPAENTPRPFGMGRTGIEVDQAAEERVGLECVFLDRVDDIADRIEGPGGHGAVGFALHNLQKEPHGGVRPVKAEHQQLGQFEPLLRQGDVFFLLGLLLQQELAGAVGDGDGGLEGVAIGRGRADRTGRIFRGKAPGRPPVASGIIHPHAVGAEIDRGVIQLLFFLPFRSTGGQRILGGGDAQNFVDRLSQIEHGLDSVRTFLGPRRQQRGGLLTAHQVIVFLGLEIVPVGLLFDFRQAEIAARRGLRPLVLLDDIAVPFNGGLLVTLGPLVVGQLQLDHGDTFDLQLLGKGQ